jgi:hypothetical protein
VVDNWALSALGAVRERRRLLIQNRRHDASTSTALTGMSNRALSTEATTPTPDA